MYRFAVNLLVKLCERDTVFESIKDLNFPCWASYFQMVVSSFKCSVEKTSKTFRS